MDLIWHKQVPLKVSVFAWRMLCDRLPTKSKLMIRGVISTEDRLCVVGCGHIEDALYLFILCPTSISLWPLERDWIGFVGIDTQVIHDHFCQFIYCTGGLKA